MDEHEKDASVGSSPPSRVPQDRRGGGSRVGLGAGLGGLVAACGEEEATTTSVAQSTTSTAAPTTTTAAATTSTTVESAAGREIKIGFVAPLTGALASFGVADRYCLERWEEFVVDGLVLRRRQETPIKFSVQDSQSDTNRAAQVAGDLIMNEKIDIMMVASTPETVSPVADQCEANSIPCYSNDAPWQAYFFGRAERRYAFQVDVSSLLGPGGSHRRLPGGLGRSRQPTRSSERCAQRLGRKRVFRSRDRFPSRLRALGLQDRGPRRLLTGWKTSPP